MFYQNFGSGGTPIIVLHGGPGLDQTYLQPQMLALAKNHKIIFYDQRGSGKSLETNFTPAQINLEQFTKDLEELRKQLKLDKFILLGHSWGGLLAMNYSVNYPEHLAGLILLSTAPADYTGQQAFVEEFTKRILPIKNEIAPLFDYQAFKKLNVPTIVIHGQQDIVPLWTAQKIKNTIPNAQIFILKECGHFPYIEKPNQLFDHSTLAIFPKDRSP